MKYFYLDEEREGTCYHEFQKGKWDGQSFWRYDSLLIHDDIIYALQLDSFLLSVIPTYDVYGETEINKASWNEIYNKALLLGGEIMNAIKEADKWVQKTFETEEVFTILGI